MNFTLNIFKNIFEVATSRSDTGLIPFLRNLFFPRFQFFSWKMCHKIWQYLPQNNHLLSHHNYFVNWVFHSVYVISMFNCVTHVVECWWEAVLKSFLSWSKRNIWLIVTKFRLGTFYVYYMKILISRWMVTKLSTRYL